MGAFSLPEHSDNIRHTSISVEHYTPDYVLTAVRKCLWRIDLDPASCEFAQSRVKALNYFTKEDDGFTKQWWGNVFLNPPGGRRDGSKSSQKEWWFKLAREYDECRVSEAIFIGFSIEILQTTQVNPPPFLLRPVDCVYCLPARRMRHVDAAGKEGKSPPHAGVIVYLGPDPAHFRKCFEHIGACT